jgi:hypothetical protein
VLTRSLLTLLLLAALPASVFADGNHGPGANHDHSKAVGQGRYQLVGYEPNQGVEVLDRATAVLYLIDLRMREAAALDAAKGTIVTRKLIEEKIAPPSAELTWPTQGPAPSATQSAPRYEHVRGNALIRGGTTALFDSNRGHLIVLTSGSRDVIDAPRGVHSRQVLQVKDGTGTLQRLQAGRSQRQAMMVLRGIAQAEGLFRRRSKQLRFATLAELIEAKILTKEAIQVPGYTIDVQPGKGDFAQRRFLARATPTKEGMAHLAINESGVVHGSKSPIPASEDASLPPHARPIQQPRQQPRQQPPPAQPGRGGARPGGGRQRANPYSPR